MAQHLMNVYEKYLRQFDDAYMSSLVQRFAQMQNGGQPVQNLYNGQGQPPMDQSRNGMVDYMLGDLDGLNIQGPQPLLQRYLRAQEKMRDDVTDSGSSSVLISDSFTNQEQVTTTAVTSAEDGVTHGTGE